MGHSFFNIGGGESSFITMAHLHNLMKKMVHNLLKEKLKEDEIPEGLLNFFKIMKKISITLLCEIVPTALCSHLLNITIHVNEV